jgi:hypothetical protein
MSAGRPAVRHTRGDRELIPRVLVSFSEQLAEIEKKAAERGVAQQQQYGQDQAAEQRATEQDKPAESREAILEAKKQQEEKRRCPPPPPPPPPAALLLHNARRPEKISR